MNKENQPPDSSVLDEVISCNDIAVLNDDLLIQKLADYINQLILVNFERLVHLLYRIDVSEAKLKYLLKENPAKDAGRIIALLIIERQVQNIKFKKEMSESERDDGGEERF
jgi:hypothetical protein